MIAIIDYGLGNINAIYTVYKNLDMLNIAISYGSACSSGSISVPKPLTEMGMDEIEAKNTVRISMGKMINKKDVDFLVHSIISIINRIKK